MKSHFLKMLLSFFSLNCCRFAVWLKRNTVETLPQMLHGFENSVAGTSLDGIITDDVFDVSSWLQPSLEHIKNHTKPHCFLFEKEGGEIIIKYKMWSTSPISVFLYTDV